MAKKPKKKAKKKATANRKPKGISDEQYEEDKKLAREEAELRKICKEAAKVLKPLGGRVLARRVRPEEKSEGGIILPKRAQQTPQECEVISVGPGRFDPMAGGEVKIPLKSGDHIIIVEYGAHEVQFKKTDFLVLNAETEILVHVAT